MRLEETARSLLTALAANSFADLISDIPHYRRCLCKETSCSRSFTWVVAVCSSRTVDRVAWSIVVTIMKWSCSYHFITVYHNHDSHRNIRQRSILAVAIFGLEDMRPSELPSAAALTRSVLETGDRGSSIIMDKGWWWMSKGIHDKDDQISVAASHNLATPIKRIFSGSPCLLEAPSSKTISAKWCFGQSSELWLSLHKRSLLLKCAPLSTPNLQLEIGC